MTRTPCKDVALPPDVREVTILRDRPPALREHLNRSAEALCISTIVLTELLVGAEKSNRPTQNRREVDRFTARLEVLPFDETAAANAAEIQANLRRVGQGIGGGCDTLIAGHAHSKGLIVVTGHLQACGGVAGGGLDGGFVVVVSVCPRSRATTH